MKTIWFVYPYGPIVGEKGLDFRYTRFAYVLAGKGYNVIWWTANFSHSTKQKRSSSWSTIGVLPNFSIKLVPTTSYKKNISIRRVLFELMYARNLGKRIKHEIKPDLIMTSGTGLFTAFNPIYPYIKKNKTPVIYDIMDIHMVNPYMSQNHKYLAPIVRLLTKIIETKEKKFYQLVNGVTGLGRNQLITAIDRTGNRNIPTELIYNGINVDKFRFEMNNSNIDFRDKDEPDWLYCIYAGALGPSYDIDSIIGTAEFAKNNNDRIKFIFAGSGPQVDAIKIAAKTNNRIIYLGILNPKELVGFYSQCDVGLCTYASYSTVDMPDKFYDYCAAGLAIINSLNGEIKEHILNNHLGFQYEAGNCNDLYRKIRDLEDASVLSSCKKNAYAMASNFDIQKLINKLVIMMEKLMNY